MTTQTRPRPRRRPRAAPRGIASAALSGLRPALSPAPIGLGLIIGAGLALRLYPIEHGLPYVYNVDEAQHFTSRAIAMLGGDLDPGYFDNPSALTYLIHFALRFQYGGLWPFGDLQGVMDALSANASGAFITGRAISAVLCMLAVAALFFIGRRLWGTAEGLVAAAVLSFAFLPVAYSRLALTDVGVLLPVSLAIHASVRIREDGGRRHFLLCGAAIGLAVGFKYTAGVVVAPFLVAAALRAHRDRGALVDAALALVAAAVVFFATTPYFVLELGDALAELGGQSDRADAAKAGQRPQSPLVFYLGSLTWGLGGGAALAAAGGLLWQLRDDPVRALLLVLAPVILVVYLSGAERFFARWLLPAYPVLALLAGVGLVWLARRISTRPALRVGALAVLLAAVLAQPLAADVRTARVLAREDTRQIARDFLVSRFPAGTRIVIEPSVPRSYYRGRFERGYGLGTIQGYTGELRPGLIDRYRRTGHCVVVTMSSIRDRASVAGDSEALAYYARLEQESRLLFTALPYREGAGPIPFEFGSYATYYPSAFARPGPEVRVYRLEGCAPQRRGAARS